MVEAGAVDSGCEAVEQVARLYDEGRLSGIVDSWGFANLPGFQQPPQAIIDLEVHQRAWYGDECAQRSQSCPCGEKDKG